MRLLGFSCIELGRLCMRDGGNLSFGLRCQCISHHVGLSFCIPQCILIIKRDHETVRLSFAVIS